MGPPPGCAGSPAARGSTFASLVPRRPGLDPAGLDLGAHHVFAGNRLDQTPVMEVVRDLNQRFQLQRVVLVGDRGMVKLANLEELRQAKQGYLALVRTLS